MFNLWLEKIPRYYSLLLLLVVNINNVSASSFERDMEGFFKILFSIVVIIIIASILIAVIPLVWKYVILPLLTLAVSLIMLGIVIGVLIFVALAMNELPTPVSVTISVIAGLISIGRWIDR